MAVYGLYGCVWLCMAVYGCVWLCMAVYGGVWLCMACMAVYDYVWLCMACMAMYGGVWLCMAMYDYALLCMHGFFFLYRLVISALLWHILHEFSFNDCVLALDGVEVKSERWWRFMNLLQPQFAFGY